MSCLIVAGSGIALVDGAGLLAVFVGFDVWRAGFPADECVDHTLLGMEVTSLDLTSMVFSWDIDMQ